MSPTNLVYLSDNTTVLDPENWAYVFLPTEFKFDAYLVTGGSDTYSDYYGHCWFGANPVNGQAYSVDNPPPGGWAYEVAVTDPNTEAVTYTPVAYTCDLGISKAAYDALN